MKKRIIQRILYAIFTISIIFYTKIRDPSILHLLDIIIITTFIVNIIIFFYVNEDKTIQSSLIKEGNISVIDISLLEWSKSENTLISREINFLTKNEIIAIKLQLEKIKQWEIINYDFWTDTITFQCNSMRNTENTWRCFLIFQNSKRRIEVNFYDIYNMMHLL